MNSIKAIAFIALVSVALFSQIGCQSATSPGNGIVLSPGQSAPGDDIQAAVKRGRAYAQQECAACHRYYLPHEFTPVEWSDIIWRMGKRAGIEDHRTRDIEAYFVAISSR